MDAAAAAFCHQDAPQSLLRAVRQFNSGRWFECHETLEELWLAESGPGRDLYKGVLQVAIACLHTRRGKYRGALSLLEGGCRYLEPFAGICLQLDVDALLHDARALRRQLERLGEEGMAGLDPDRMPVIRLVAPSD